MTANHPLPATGTGVKAPTAKLEAGAAGSDCVVKVGGGLAAERASAFVEQRIPKSHGDECAGRARRLGKMGHFAAVISGAWAQVVCGIETRFSLRGVARKFADLTATGCECGHGRTNEQHGGKIELGIGDSLRTKVDE